MKTWPYAIFQKLCAIFFQKKNKDCQTLLCPVMLGLFIPVGVFVSTRPDPTRHDKDKGIEYGTDTAKINWTRKSRRLSTTASQEKNESRARPH